MDIEKKELGKLIGAAKRVWTGAKTERVNLDKIERQESALFANDLELARLVKQKQILDAEITEHIDSTLHASRGYDAVELYHKRQEALKQLLKDCIHEFDSTNGLYACDNEEGKELFRLDNIQLVVRLTNALAELEKGE